MIITHHMLTIEQLFRDDGRQAPQHMSPRINHHRLHPYVPHAQRSA